MPHLFRLPLLALVIATPGALSAQSVQDFQLPPNPTPSASPRAQGPVDTEGGSLPASPRVIATPTPTPSPRPAATIQAIPTPASSPSPVTGAGSTTLPANQSGDIPRVSARPLPDAVERLPLDPGETAPIVPAPIPSDASEAPASTGPVPAEPAVQPEEANGEGAPDWLWPALGGGALALLGMGYLATRRRRIGPPPEIERPVVMAGGLVDPSQIALKAEALKLTRSVMNATLHYRVSLVNKATRALSNVAVGADIVSAHGGLPVEQQVASALQPLETRHTFERISPGQSVRYEGRITVPLSEVRAIRQSNAALFVPLLRLRIDGACEQPLVRTFVVGLGVPGGGRVTPFRIDEGPRSYQPIAARALD